MTKQVVYVGADPEVFMFKDGVPVSAHNAIPGTKKDPHKVKKGAVQVDGMALEFNIDPALTAGEFAGNVQAVMNQLKLMVPEYELVAVPVAQFGKEYIDAQPMEAKELGCEPDFNAYTGQVNPRPDVDAPFRTGAGHIHIGWNHLMDVEAFDPYHPEHMEACCTMVKELDLGLGLASLNWDTDAQRRELYGALGAFRPKPYGVEYRVLSNKWLDNPKLMTWIFNTVQLTFKRLVGGHKMQDEHLRRVGKNFKGGYTNNDLIAHYYGWAHVEKLGEALGKNF